MHTRLSFPPLTRVALVALVACVACGGDATEAPRAEIIDSAGVRVVVNAPPDAGRDAAWTVASEAGLEVGVLEGPPEYQLYQVAGAAVLSDGTLVVANRGSHELRFYDAQGAHLHSAGGQGDGPGEFQALNLIDRFAGDSLLTFDLRNRRASVFTGNGTFVRSFRIGEAADVGFPSIAGAFSSGRIVVRRGAVYMAGEATTGPDRGPVQLLVAGPEGAVTDSLDTFPGSEAFVLSTANMISVRSLTFGRAFIVSVVGETVALGNNDTFSVRVYDADGAIRHVVRQSRDPVAIEADDFARFEESQLEQIEDDDMRRQTEDVLRQMPQHETFPAYASLRLDRSGYLWVEDYRRPGDEQPVWQVFDPEGVLVTPVRTPEGMRILDIGDDYVLGVVRDDFDVERVRLHRLEKRST
jgi:hypothetical protein